MRVAAYRVRDDGFCCVGGGTGAPRRAAAELRLGTAVLASRDHEEKNNRIDGCAGAVCQLQRLIDR